MPGKTIGIVIGVLTLVGLVAFIILRPPEGPANNQNTASMPNQNIDNSLTNADRSFQTNTNTETSAETETNTGPSSQTVVISASGTNPRSLSIQANTVMVFQNNDSVTHQISSDPHPAHTDLPGFDLVIPAGSSRSYTFTRTGNWGYHDHGLPFDRNFQGVITTQ